MPNPIAKTIPALVISAGDALQAATIHGGTIGLWQNDATEIKSSIDALLAAADAFERARTELARRRRSVRELVDISRGQLTLARDIFKATLGPDYNESWDSTGLIGSLVIPGATEDVQPLLRSFSFFLTLHPGEEFPAKAITAEKFNELFLSLDQARASFREQQLAVGLAQALREEKMRALRKRMRDLIAELNMLLDPLDLRWCAFGFNMPGARETPEAPENVIATPVAPGKVDVKWEPAPNTDYYRVWKRVIGTDPELTVVGTAADLDFMMDEVPSGATMELAVSAINESGESRLSELVTVKT